MEYCRSDVRLLKEGCQQFQQAFQALADFNPMAECITIASACNRYYRKKNACNPSPSPRNPFEGGMAKANPIRTPPWNGSTGSIINSANNGKARRTNSCTLTTKANIPSPWVDTKCMWTGSTPPPKPSRNSKAVFITGVSRVFPIGTNCIANTIR